MKLCLFFLLGFSLVACTGISDSPTPGAGAVVPSVPESEATPTPMKSPPLPDLGPAPELTNQVWLNTEAPLRLADLRGQVVLLEMWTFG